MSPPHEPLAPLSPSPRVSVVIPCFNQGRFVADAVRSCVNQTAGAPDIVIVNDGSDDGVTPDLCDQAGGLGPGVRVIHQANRGLPGARNRGARETDGELLVFLDADDWIEPRFVESLTRALRDAEASGPPASHAYCQERLVELGTGVWRVPEWDPQLLMITNLHPVTALVRRECFERARGFDESMRSGYEDWDLWLRMHEKGFRGVRVAEPLFVWRRHSPETMVMRVIHDHESLFRRIMANHRELYDAHAGELVARMSTMMRAWDVNWIDETGVPIPLRYLWTVRDTREALIEEARRAGADRARADYEAMAAVRVHRAIQRGIDSLPGPFARSARRVLAWAKGVVEESRPR